jgi:hypothetical protein
LLSDRKTSKRGFYVAQALARHGQVCVGLCLGLHFDIHNKQTIVRPMHAIIEAVEMLFTAQGQLKVKLEKQVCEQQ